MMLLAEHSPKLDKFQIIRDGISINFHKCLHVKRTSRMRLLGYSFPSENLIFSVRIFCESPYICDTMMNEKGALITIGFRFELQHSMNVAVANWSQLKLCECVQNLITLEWLVFVCTNFSHGQKLISFFVSSVRYSDTQ